MTVDSFRELIEALHRERVRFLVVGGLAVAAHGYLRFTKDVDLVVELDPANVRRAFDALRSAGYLPHAPVTPADFADAEIRKRLIREKNLVVLAFWSDRHRETPVDVFVTEPFPFGEEYESALVKELAPGLPVRFLRREALVRMKRSAGRPQDLVDAQELEELGEKDAGR